MFLGCSVGVPGVFRGVPGVFRGVPGVFLVLHTPKIIVKSFRVTLWFRLSLSNEKANQFKACGKKPATCNLTTFCIVYGITYVLCIKQINNYG